MFVGGLDWWENAGGFVNMQNKYFALGGNPTTQVSVSQEWNSGVLQAQSAT